MKGLLVRVGADQSDAGGNWNGPCDSTTRQFVYVPIHEDYPVRPGFQHLYDKIEPSLSQLSCQLPPQLKGKRMHLDPDFSYLTYGDQGQRAKQIKDKLGQGDLIVFYAGLQDVRAPRLIYAIIGLYIIDTIVPAVTISETDWDSNAHTRRILSRSADDIVVHGRAGMSGRLFEYVEIGEFRERAYRVKPTLLKAWGGLSVKDGYLQRSARLPEFLSADSFYKWFLSCAPKLIETNN